MAPEVLLDQKTKTATLELLEQGGLTAHWPRLLDAIRESVGTLTEMELAEVCRKLRARDMVAFAMWVGEQIRGYIVMQPVNRIDAPAMNIYAIHGADITMDQWGTFVNQAAYLLKIAGYTRMLAISNNPRVLEIVRRTGWKVSNYCERVL